MANKNTLLGGTDWANNDNISHTDLNDTFNAAWDKIRTLSTFWLNSDLYTVYDDFDTEDVGSITTNTKWTFASQNGDTAVAASTNAGGATRELVLTATDTADNLDTASAVSKLLLANHHTFVKLYCSTGAGGFATNTCNVRFSKAGGYYAIVSGRGNNFASLIHVINTDTGDYDLYIAGKLVAQYAAIADANAQIEFTVTAKDEGSADTAASTMYIDDIRQSSHTAI